MSLLVISNVPHPLSSPIFAMLQCSSEVEAYGQAASNLVAGSGLEQTIQQILDMGGGTWDRDTVVRALRAAFNNPERAVEYLYSVRFIPFIFFIGFNYALIFNLFFVL